MSEDRLVEIETKLAHQEHLLDELNTVITKQQEIIRRLEERYEILVSRLRSISETLPADGEQQERPPHY
jgi:SlyX protein